MKKNILAICSLILAFPLVGQAMQPAISVEKTSKDYPTPDRSKVLAFPGADGAGKYTTGGAGGTVYTVTSLADDGSEGTLRWAISKKGPRTIVFAVSGIIELQKALKLSNGDVTIAGQTAPGDGICLKNYTFSIQADNVIIRFIRSRMGVDIKQKGDDAMNGTKAHQNIIIDHCSMSWCTDECATFYDNRNFTLQWCIISESLANSIHEKGAHGYGGIWGGQPATFHHNLLAHHTNRTPRLCGSRYTGRPEDEKVELFNNVIYNYGSDGAYAGEGGSYNFINNYYKPGPATTARVKEPKFFRQSSARDPEKAPLRAASKWFFDGNVMEGNSDLTSDNWKGIYTDGNYPYSLDEMKASSFIVSSGKDNYEQYWFDWEAYTLSENYESAEKAFQSVIGDNGAGAFPRDKVDARIIKDVKGGSCTYTGAGDDKSGPLPGIINSPEEAEGFEGLTYNTSGVITDADKDSMDDAWEKKVGLDPTNSEDRNKTTDIGYTALEVYINSLVNESISYNFKK